MGRIESQQGPLDPIFGQRSVFSLSDEGVNPDVLQYLNQVRCEALESLPLDDDEASVEEVVQDPIALNEEEDASELVLEDSQGINSWVEELRQEMEPLDESASDSLYTEEMLDLLVVEIRKYLDQHPEEVNDSVRRVVSKITPVSNPQYEISADLVKSVMKRLQNKRFSDIVYLKRYINRPPPIPSNFRQWFGHMKHNEPSRQFMLRLSFEDLMKMVGYMMQWVADISKSKPDSIRLQQWLFYMCIFIPRELLSQQVSQLRELGKKCQAILSKTIDLQLSGLVLPKELQEIAFPENRSSLNALEIALSVIAHRFGQTDLLTQQ